MKKQPKKNKKSGNARALKRERKAKERLRSVTSLPNDPIRKIERALDEYTRSGTPDIVGFKGWLSDWFSSTTTHRDDIFLRHASGGLGSNPDKFTPLYNVFEKYRKLFENLEHESETPKRVEKSTVFSKRKLLLSGVGERLQDAFECFRVRESGAEIRLDEGLSNCSQAELRFRLSEALDTDQERIAFKLLGKLREGDHHRDELLYLEAMSYFRLGDFETSLKYAAQVGVGSIDYVSAQGILLETQAFLGNVEDLARGLSNPDAPPISKLFRHYLTIVVVSNSDDPIATVDHIANTVPIPTDINRNDPVFAVFNRYVCRLGSEYVDILNVRGSFTGEERQLGSESKGPSRDKTDPELNSSKLDFSDEYLRSLELRECQIYLALAIDVGLILDILSKSDESRHHALIDRALNFAPHPTHRDFFFSFMIQYKHSSPGVFVENITSNLSSILSYPGESKWDLLQLALDEAVILDEPCTVQLTEALSQWPQFGDRTEFVKEHSRTGWSFLTALTPMGKSSYTSAEWMLSRAETEGLLHYDAGMISLGFFRILEIELNMRLFYQLKTKPFLAEFREELRVFYDSGPSNRYTKFWNRNADKLVKHAVEDDHSLDLGSIEVILSKLKNLEGPDASLKTLLFDTVTSSVPEGGKHALRDGTVLSFIDAKHRETFRNPPAHARFLPISVAKNCKNHVDKALMVFVESLPLP
jgi:hypothetical protein